MANTLGKISSEKLSAVMDVMDSEVNDIRFQLEEMLKELEGIEEGIDGVREFLINSEEKDLQSGMDHLKDGIDNSVSFYQKLQKSYEKITKSYEELTEKGDGSNLCFSCQHMNPIDIEFCEKCGTKLFITFEKKTLMEFAESGEATYGGYGMTKFTKPLVDAVENIKNEKITTEEFTAVLDDITVKVKHAEAEAIKILSEIDRKLPKNKPFRGKERYEEALKILEEGVSQFKNGLSILRLYTENPSPSYLENGLTEVLEGNQMIFKFPPIVDSIVEECEEAERAEKAKEKVEVN